MMTEWALGIRHFHHILIKLLVMVSMVLATTMSVEMLTPIVARWKCEVRDVERALTLLFHGIYIGARPKSFLSQLISQLCHNMVTICCHTQMRSLVIRIFIEMIVLKVAMANILPGIALPISLDQGNVSAENLSDLRVIAQAYLVDHATRGQGAYAYLKQNPCRISHRQERSERTISIKYVVSIPVNEIKANQAFSRSSQVRKQYHQVRAFTGSEVLSRRSLRIQPTAT